MDSKLRCVFEMPVENEKTVSNCNCSPPLLVSLCKFAVPKYQRVFSAWNISMHLSSIFKITGIEFSMVSKCIINCQFSLSVILLLLI